MKGVGKLQRTTGLKHRTLAREFLSPSRLDIKPSAARLWAPAVSDGCTGKPMRARAYSEIRSAINPSVPAKETGPGLPPSRFSWLQRTLSRALAPVAAVEAVAVVPGRCPLPESPIRPGTSA